MKTMPTLYVPMFKSQSTYVHTKQIENFKFLNQ